MIAFDYRFKKKIAVHELIFILGFEPDEIE
jgi:hypothetical protein